MSGLTVFAIFCVFASVASQSHDLVVGIPSYDDVVLYESYEIKYGWPFLVRYSFIEFPASGQRSYAHIKAIYVKDNYDDDTGGYASIVAGGIDQQFVTIKLKSQWCYGFNFTATIYGRYY